MGVNTIFFIGKPGCGKGTQAKLLSEKTGWPIFASGALFREIAKTDTPVGRKIKMENDAGMLAPHWFAMHLYLNALLSVSDDSGAIFDGFNRKLPEADLVINSLRWLDRPFKVFNITVSDEEIRRRLAGRKIIEGRADDTAVDERLKEYYEYTEPAIQMFREAGVLVEIQGEQSPERISEDIHTALNKASVEG